MFEHGFDNVQKFCCKFCIVFKAFWQHKFDIKRLFKGERSQIGVKCLNFMVNLTYRVSQKNFLLPNLALANIAVDGEKSNNTVLTNPYQARNTVMKSNPTSAIFIKCILWDWWNLWCHWNLMKSDWSSASASGSISSVRCTAHAIPTSTSCRPTSQRRWHRLVLWWSGGQCWTWRQGLWSALLLTEDTLRSSEEQWSSYVIV